MADGTSGAPGHIYEARLCMLLFCRGYASELKHFKLRYQLPESEAGKFDDLFFDTGVGNKYFFQLKYTGVKKNISNSALLSKILKTDYNLIKYVKAVNDIKLNSTLKDEVMNTILFTNINFEDLDKIDLKLMPEMMPNEKPIFDISNSFPAAKYYKFQNIYYNGHKLKDHSKIVAQGLRNKLKDPKRKDVIEKTEADVKFLENVTVEQILNALPYIVYAVQQPDYEEIKGIIQNEMIKNFKLYDKLADTMYNDFEVKFLNWCNTKQPFVGHNTGDDPQVIKFKNAEVFFKNHVKEDSFGVEPPTPFFPGRTDDLTKIRKTLETEHALIVSGPIGIGKTELVRQFIKEFGKLEFYGRVFWINAESDESVARSFSDLAEKLNIQKKIYTYKYTKIIIEQIFDYFEEVKVLFVFERFNNSEYDFIFMFI